MTLIYPTNFRILRPSSRTRTVLRRLAQRRRRMTCPKCDGCGWRDCGRTYSPYPGGLCTPVVRCNACRGTGAPGRRGR